MCEHRITSTNLNKKSKQRRLLIVTAQEVRFWKHKNARKMSSGIIYSHVISFIFVNFFSKIYKRILSLKIFSKYLYSYKIVIFFSTLGH